MKITIGARDYPAKDVSIELKNGLTVRIVDDGDFVISSYEVEPSVWGQSVSVDFVNEVLKFNGVEVDKVNRMELAKANPLTHEQIVLFEEIMWMAVAHLKTSTRHTDTFGRVVTKQDVASYTERCCDLFNWLNKNWRQ